MKKVAIYTLNGNFNYGNRLQNYALQEVIKSLNYECETVILKNKITVNLLIKNFKKIVKIILCMNKRENNFKKFSKKYIIETRESSKKYDYYVCGSDQVWNYTFDTFSDKYLFAHLNIKNKISYAASIGLNKIDDEYKNLFKENLMKFKAISLREEKGNELVKELTNRVDIETVIDPTMLVDETKWNKIMKKPEILNANNYILTYFLGDLSANRKKEIIRVANENNCEIINIMDKKSPYYNCDPAEFLYLEKHAFLICTDSFHSSVFALLFNRPFIIFDREQKAYMNMNSRLKTLVEKFDLKNRTFEGKITEDNLNHDYTLAFKILKEERKKSMLFLKNALDYPSRDGE